MRPTPRARANPESRIARLAAAAPDAEAVVVSALMDIRWATGFTGSNALLIVTRKDAHLLTDGRYTEQAEREVEGARIHVVSGDLFETAARKLLVGFSRIAIQSDSLTLNRAEDLFAMTELHHITWSRKRGLVRELRSRKDPSELAAIRAAQRLTEHVFEQILHLITPGVTEQEVASAIVAGHLRGGASRMAFDPIVASGPNAALPHARPTDRRIQSGEAVLIDVGCFLDGYASDMTRMVSLGDPGPEFTRVYDVVRSALEASLAAARAGITSRELDASARTVIEGAGFGKHFTHSLGHGVGLEVHEAPPVSFRSDDILPEQAVITLEPGVYLSGRFGVRIEDLVFLTAGGCDRLTTLSHDLVLL